MVIIKTVDLQNFEAWGGGASTLNYLSTEEIEEVQNIISEIFPHGVTETELNDFLWFEDDTIAEWLGYEDFTEIIER